MEWIPGIDGLMAEFYTAFWAVLGSGLVEYSPRFDNLKAASLYFTLLRSKSQLRFSAWSAFCLSARRSVVSTFQKKRKKEPQELEANIFTLC